MGGVGLARRRGEKDLERTGKLFPHPVVGKCGVGLGPGKRGRRDESMRKGVGRRMRATCAKGDYAKKGPQLSQVIITV